MDNEKPLESQNKKKIWPWLILVAVIAVAAACYFLFFKSSDKDSESEPDYEEYLMPSYLMEEDDSIKIAADSIVAEPEEKTQKTKTGKSSRHNSYSSDVTTDVDEENEDPDYAEGGKYDPAKYHTDYSSDQEERRRSYIDNDGFDDDDGYDEYRGYEHENERSEQWEE